MSDNHDRTLQALDHGLALADRSDRMRMRVTGKDRVRFLHNTTTNDVKSLALGASCEAFVTSLQGRTLAWVTLHVEPEAILMRGDANAWDDIAPHFQKYGALDDVDFDDVSGDTFEWHATGGALNELSSSIHALANQHADLLILSEAPLGTPGLTLIGPRAHTSQLRAALESVIAGRPFIEVAPQDREALRIEAGTPVFGRDISPANLPQEIARDALAISFKKGCYIGQETVARLDALGHVNKILRRLRATTDVALQPGQTLYAEGKPAGTITSAARSIRTQLPVALGIVRSAHATPGTRLSLDADSTEAPIEVVALDHK